jgi:hypothetical protein
LLREGEELLFILEYDTTGCSVAARQGSEYTNHLDLGGIPVTRL